MLSLFPQTLAPTSQLWRPFLATPQGHLLKAYNRRSCAATQSYPNNTLPPFCDARRIRSEGETQKIWWSSPIPHKNEGLLGCLRIRRCRERPKIEVEDSLTVCNQLELQLAIGAVGSHGVSTQISKMRGWALHGDGFEPTVIGSTMATSGARGGDADRRAEGLYGGANIGSGGATAVKYGGGSGPLVPGPIGLSCLFWGWDKDFGPYLGPGNKWSSHEPETEKKKRRRRKLGSKNKNPTASAAKRAATMAATKAAEGNSALKDEKEAAGKVAPVDPFSFCAPPPCPCVKGKGKI